LCSQKQPNFIGQLRLPGLVNKLGFAERGQGWQGSKMQAYWWVVRILLTPPAEATASQKWKIIYLHVLSFAS
jgi:hypothetical protein